MGQAEIRRLQTQDVEAYRDVRLSTLATEPDYFGSTWEEESVLPLSHFADRLVGAAVFGACTPDSIVGVAHLRRATRPSEAHKALVQGFFVEPGWRRRGIGAALMRAVIEAARGQVEQLTLSVMQGNDAAIAFYQRFGFVIYGIEPRSRKTSRGPLDEILMVLRLTAN